MIDTTVVTVASVATAMMYDDCDYGCNCSCYCCYCYCTLQLLLLLLMLTGGVTVTVVIATTVVTVSNVAIITSRITHDDRDGGDCYCYFIDSCLVLFISHFNSFNNILHASSY